MILQIVALALTLTGQNRPWSINEYNTLLWDGKPYMPVGLHIDGSTAAVEQAKAAGIGDVVIDLPVEGLGWDSILQALNAANIRYLISINSSAPNGIGFSVEPECYRVTGITQPDKLEITIPGGLDAYCLLATKRDSEVQSTQRLPIVNGRLTINVNPKNDLEHVLLIYPMVKEMRLPDYWEEFDTHRDTLIGALRRQKFGAGIRGIINPMGRLVRFPGPDTRFVPMSDAFHMEYESFLRNKYTSVQTCVRAWSMNAADLDAFADLARLVPLWSAARGLPLLWDPKTDRTYPCDSKQSIIWKDIQEVVRNAGLRRFERLVAAIQQVADVPVLQDWNGWTGPYENAKSALNGMGMRMSGSSPGQIIESGSRAAAAMLRWNRPALLFATDLQLTGPGAPLDDALNSAATLGARGWFVRANTDTDRKAVASQIRAFSTDASFAQWKPTALFYPESAANPAMAMRLAGGRWWLPAPGSGNRLDFGSAFAGYRYADGGQLYTAIWAIGQPRKAKLHLADPKAAKIDSLDGSDLKAKVTKKYIELVVPTTPILVTGTDEFPVPDVALEETVGGLERIFAVLDKMGPGLGEEKLSFKDNFNAFDRSPGGAYLALRQQWRRLTLGVSRAVWLEAEVSRDTTFSEPIALAGASGNGALRLDARISLPGKPYFANYMFGTRFEGEHTIWVSGAFTESEMKKVTLRIGDQTLSMQGPAYSGYGPGLAWYKAGTLNLAKSAMKLTVSVDASEGANMLIDSIVIGPSTWTPNGISVPELTMPGK